MFKLIFILLILSSLIGCGKSEDKKNHQNELLK